MKLNICASIGVIFAVSGIFAIGNDTNLSTTVQDLGQIIMAAATCICLALVEKS